MANVLLTNYCNRQCSYCFAREKVSLPGENGGSERPRNLPLEELDWIIDFLRISQLKDFAVIGGEPTLHPQFIEAMKRIEAAGFERIKLFTNALMCEEHLAFLAGLSPDLLRILVNVNHPDEEAPDLQSRQRESLRALGKRAAVGFNIHSPDCDMMFLPGVIREFGLVPQIRLGVSEPIVGANNRFVALEDYALIARKIVGLAEECDKHDISVGLDCGFPLCMFTSEELGLMTLWNVNLNFRCSPIIDIGPGLRAWHCFPLSGVENVSLTDFRDLRELIEYYEAKLGAYRNVGMLEDCLDCRHKRRGQCAGGCMAHTMRSFATESPRGLAAAGNAGSG